MILVDTSKVAASVGLLKIFTQYSIVLNVIDAALIYSNKVLLHPGEKNWQIDISDMAFDSKIGKFKGGIELTNALGFDGPVNNSRFLNVRTTALNPSITKDTLTTMKRGVMELQQHLNGLAYLEIANVHAASSAMNELGAKSLAASTSKTPTAQVINMPSANTWRQLFEAVIGYGDAILRNPTSQNHRRINTNLAISRRK